MRLWILSLIASITCMVAPGYAENPFSDEIWEVLNYRRKLDRGDWLPYFCPEHTSLFAEECAVWNQFLHKSTGLSYDEYSNCVKRELESMFKAIDKKERFP